MLDTKITGGAIIDGTGKAAFLGSVGIKDGRIVAVGEVDEPARETIDASGRVVAPGFIDVHTHYDAQVFWDPALSPSCFHGVTTVIGGFCGFSIAPLDADSADYIKPMLARVEGMPLETLNAAIDWDWSSFGDYLGRLEGKIGLNAGFFVGHSAVRRIAMGKRAVGERATTEEIERMKELVGQSLGEGALGFSSTVSESHSDGDGNPVPSRWAAPEEFIELARVVSKYEGTGLELLPDVEFAPGMAEMMADFSIAGQRAVNWNVMAVTGSENVEERVERQLKASDLAKEMGGEIIALTLPSAPETYITLRSGISFDTLPGIWSTIFKVPPEERIRRFAVPELRQQLAEDAARIADQKTVRQAIARLPDYRVVVVVSEANQQFVGRRIGEIAADLGKEPIDVMMDIAIADDLDTIFSPNYGGDDRKSYELRGRLWADDRTLIGASDAGAHLDMLDTFAFSTTVLEKGVREYQVISLEQAVHKMTLRIAEYLGLVDRGKIAEGCYADIVVFDPDTISRGPTYFKRDLPGDSEAFRIYADAEGIDHVLVNGVEIVRKGEHTGKLPGAVLRSGKDTRTVPIGTTSNYAAAAA